MPTEVLITRLEQAALMSFDDLPLVLAEPGIYAAWASEVHQGVFYVGRSRNVASRLQAHYSGDRSGDRFCLYVYDRYVWDTRTQGMTTLGVNHLTRDWIREPVRFRWLPVDDPLLAGLEIHLRQRWQPLLNPLPPFANIPGPQA